MCDQAAWAFPGVLILTSALLIPAELTCAQDALPKSLIDRGFRAIEAGRFETAEALFLAAVTEGKRSETYAPSTADSLRGLGKVRLNQGRNADAIELLQRAVQLAAESEGPSTKLVADAVHDLASAYAAVADYVNAETLYRHSLELREELLGPDNPDVATSLNSLAMLHRARGDYPAALTLSRMALGITQNNLGPDHPATASALQNLATCCWAVEKYDEAQAGISEALRIRQSCLGSEHPLIASSLCLEARIQAARGDYANAENTCRLAMQISVKFFGADHEESALLRRSVAVLAQVNGRPKESRMLLEQGLNALRRKSLREAHCDLQPLTRRGLELADERKFGEAEAVLSSAWRLSEQQFGPDAPETLRLLRLTADAIGAQGRATEREILRAWAEADYAEPDHLNFARRTETRSERTRLR